MIEPGELHRYFKIREIATGRELWLMNWDVRYEVTDGGGYGSYRMAPDGGYFLVRSAGMAQGPWGRCVRLEDVEPLKRGAGRYAELDELTMGETYEGSWRQYADQAGPEVKSSSEGEEAAA